MSLDFSKDYLHINGSGNTTPQFFKKGFWINRPSSPSPGWQDVTVSGENEVSLINAKANGLNYLKLFGKCEQTGTPTPLVPIDIKCNNGTLKTRKSSGLPDGYTRVKSLVNNTSGDKTKLDTGVSPNDGDIIEIRYTWSSASNSSNYIFQARRNSSAGIYGISGSQTGNRIGCAINNDGVTLPNITRQNGHTYLIRASFIDGVATLYAKDETANIEETATGTYTYADTTATFYIWGNTSNTLAYVAPVDYVKITNGDTTRLHYVAATNVENTPGFYDLVNNQFISTMTVGSVTAGDIATDPAIIYTDGTVETVKDSLNNTATAEILYGLSDNNRDYQEIKTGVITRQTGILVFDGTESWASSNGAFNLSDVATNILYGSTYSCICTHYTGGVPSQSVAAMPDLSCKVGANSATIRNRLYIKDTRFAGTTAFKEFLKDEFNKGTPVIMIYPKNENETESTTPQTLTTKRGENTIEITQASINPLKLEAQYKAGAEVTITEVEDANLDNNVTVVIGD